MEMIKVESSNIRAIGWENNTLYVEFNNGVYLYENVNKDIYDNFLKAESKGKYMCEEIKGKYNYKRAAAEHKQILLEHKAFMAD